MPTVDKIESTGHKYKGIVKTPHRNFPKPYLEKTTNNLLSGMYFVMESANNGKAI